MRSGSDGEKEGGEGKRGIVPRVQRAPGINNNQPQRSVCWVCLGVAGRPFGLSDNPATGVGSGRVGSLSGGGGSEM